MNARYPVQLDVAEDGITVTFPGLPFGITSGTTISDALEQAQDCLVVIITSLIHDGADVPEPPTKGRFKYWVELPEDVALKLAFYRSFTASGLSKAELGRRLGWHNQLVARLFDAAHATRIDKLLEAIHALGLRVRFDLEAVPQPKRRKRAA